MTKEFSITFKRKGSVQVACLDTFVWYLKESKAGNYDRISGEVTYPVISDDCNSAWNSPKALESEGESNTPFKYVSIDGSRYQISKKQIRDWLNIYGEL